MCLTFYLGLYEKVIAADRHQLVLLFLFLAVFGGLLISRPFCFVVVISSALFVARSAFETRAAFIFVLNLLECLGGLALRMPFVELFGNCWTILFPHSWSSARSDAACCSAFGRY